MKIQVGVMGSAGGILLPEHLKRAYQLGRGIAERDCVLVTGACPGLPDAAAHGAHDAGGFVLGVSPAISLDEHIRIYSSPTEPYDAMVFTSSGLMGREVHNIHSSDFVLFIGGRSGTLGEFAIAFDEGKLIGILRDTGGIINELPAIARLIEKDTGSEIVVENDPLVLLDACFQAHRRRGRSSRPRIEEAMLTAGTSLPDERS
ncbi:MAG TPA: hypothetical protein VGZ00_01275 [Candidatus Baltobacteraceae bacterium]|jgi:hypothetical protein|nr:hypothetical protein [Candidatus Baltobacteraceae bacterium]